MTNSKDDEVANDRGQHGKPEEKDVFPGLEVASYKSLSLPSGNDDNENDAHDRENDSEVPKRSDQAVDVDAKTTFHKNPLWLDWWGTFREPFPMFCFGASSALLFAIWYIERWFAVNVG
jgi:hypothetical protein